MAEPIIKNLDIWVTAQTLKTSGRGRSASNQRLYGVNKLRELILELAIQGKLVSQNHDDESARLLLKKIASEKVRMVKEGIIKPLNKLTEITEDEKPFVSPIGWEWSRLGDVCNIVRGITFSANEKSTIPEEGRVACLRTTNVQDKIEWEDLLFIREEFVKRENQFILENDIVMSMANSRELVGKVAIVDPMPKFRTTFGGFLGVIRPLNFSPFYLMLLLRVPTNRNLLIDSASQTTNIANVSLTKLYPLVLAIPPLAEQHRIVAKVDELMALCDQLEQQQTDTNAAHEILVETLLDTLTNAADQSGLEQAWNRIANHFDVLFTTEHSIDRLKQTILQLAIMGKLVPQNPTDEPASELLKKIAKEKARLVKEGKIKPQKSLPKLGDDDEPYKLPERWLWARIGDASLFTEYGMSEVTFDGIKGIPVLKMGDIQSGNVLLGGQKLVPENVEGIPSLYLKKWDILYNRTNSAELVGKTGIFEGQDDTYTFASYLIRIRCSECCVYPKYLNLSMNSPLFRVTQIEPHVKQQCGQANVNGTILKNMVVPIPPLAEQHRIVSKVDELFAICDAIKERINEAQVTQLNLADALAEGALN